MARRSVSRKYSELEQRSQRLDPGDRDLTDIDEMELYLAEHLRDWQLLIGIQSFSQLVSIMDDMLTAAKSERAVVKNDLGREQYIEGQTNVIETVIQQLTRAIDARKGAIGKAVKWEPPTR